MVDKNTRGSEPANLKEDVPRRTTYLIACNATKGAGKCSRTGNFIYNIYRSGHLFAKGIIYLTFE